MSAGRHTRGRCGPGCLRVVYLSLYSHTSGKSQVRRQSRAVVDMAANRAAGYRLRSEQTPGPPKGSDCGAEGKKKKK